MTKGVRGKDTVLRHRRGATAASLAKGVWMDFQAGENPYAQSRKDGNQGRKKYVSGEENATVHSNKDQRREFKRSPFGDGGQGENRASSENGSQGPFAAGGRPSLARHHTG